MKSFKVLLIAAIAVIILQACSPAGGEFAGSEYMPDMGHSVAYEANTYNYYYHNTWDKASSTDLWKLSQPRLPVSGTIPRGYAGVAMASNATAQSAMMDELRGGSSTNGIAVPLSGNAPYYYEDTEEERLRATAEIIDNPFPITADGLARGKELYEVFCGICHGNKGDGNGYLVSEENGNAVYPAQPAIFTTDEFLAASNGRYYHAIIYGKNVMGGYADKMSYEERWQVIHWIRALQAKEKKLAYDENVNTLNETFGTPMSRMAQVADHATDHEGESHEAGHDGEEGHGEDHGEEHGEEHGGDHGEGEHK
ncbi:MAG: c-type cytochrome [Saprospiraceae bacterium]|nr:c-type cytochrome [Saprospiraceae bacterium]